MVSSKPEKEMEEMTGRGEVEYNMLSEVERLLKDLLKYKDTLVKAMDGADKRLDDVERKIGTGQIPRDIGIQIEKIEETIERLSKEIKTAKPSSFDSSELEKVKETVSKMNGEISESLETISRSLGDIEKKVEDFSRKEIITQEDLAKKADEIQDNLFTNISKLETDTQSLTKLQKDDNKFMEGMYGELKDHITSTNEGLRETSKEIAKTRKEIEKAQAFRKALGDFIKAVME